MKINQDVLTVDGKRVVVPDAKHTHWVAVNKPKSVLTTMRDELNRDTILNLVPQASELRLVPVGGLDRDDTGLMILTNELGWIHKLTHPSFPHVHRYEATIEGVLSIDTLESLNDAESSAMEDFSVRSVELVDVDPKQRTSRVSILLDQRGPQQLEEFIERLGCALVSLRRVEFAGVKLKGLKRGEWRELTDSEVLALKATVGQIGNT
jgi:23S rRNA pseudouridine2605 synthase